MQASRIPDPRWENFIEQFDANGTPIGFKLEGNDFLFKYDNLGGWTDDKGTLYDSNGVLIDDESAGEEEEESDVDDDDIVDEFEQMLIEEEEGIIRQKPKNDKKQTQPTSSSENNNEQESKKYIEKLEKKEQIRDGLSPMIWIFYKMKSNLYERIQYEAEKKQDIKARNALIQEIKVKIEAKKKQLVESNKWLSGEFSLEFSGNSLDEGVYDRYWYGYVKVTHENFSNIVEQIKKSKEFSLLKSKTLYALKSKFFLKIKMKQTITELKNSLKDAGQDEAVLVKLNNLPEEFPLSFVLDLLEISGGFLEDVEDIDIVDNFSADMIVKKRTAEIFTNIEGYPHDEKEYIWLEVERLNRPVKFNKFFNVEIDSDYKPLIRETSDVLALESSPAEIAKSYDKNEKFRLAVNQGVMKKILMFRGESLNVARIVRFEKKE